VVNATIPLKPSAPMLNGRAMCSALNVGLNLVESTLYQEFNSKVLGSIKQEDKMLKNDYPRPLESPLYSVTCDCGVTITGHSENRIKFLLGLHIESGVIHLNRNQ
jgi:hypothetical protein